MSVTNIESKMPLQELVRMRLLGKKNRKGKNIITCTKGEEYFVYKRCSLAYYVKYVE